MGQLHWHRPEQTGLGCDLAGDGGSPVMQQAGRKQARAERGSRAAAGRILLEKALWKKGRKSETKEVWTLNSFPARSRTSGKLNRRKTEHSEVPDAATMLLPKPVLTVEGEHRGGKARMNAREVKAQEEESQTS